MKVHLTVVEGNPRGAEVRLHGASFLIGRDPECQLRLKNDAVGGRHCKLSPARNYLAVRDLGTKLGTMINGIRIDPAEDAEAYHGDRLQVGTLVFEVCIEGDDRAKGPVISDDLEDDSPASLANRLIQKSLSRSADPVKGVGHHFHAEMVEGVPVVEIRMRRIVDEQEVIPFARGLRDLAERQALHKVILDFKEVKQFSPTAADRLLAFTDRLRERGDVVRLCDVDPQVLRVLDDKGVTLQVSLHIDVNDALWAI